MRIINVEKEFNDVVAYKERLKDKIEKEKQSIQKIEDKISDLKKNEFNNPKEKWKNDRAIQIQANQMGRLQRKLYTLESQLRFARPDTQEDINLRLDVHDNFATKIKDAVPKDLPLRFHGTNLWNAEQIIQSKSLTSSVERLGFETSYDAEGQLSVTDSDTLDITVTGYMDILQQHLPSGCIFVLTPKNVEDAASSKSLLMESVYLEKNPEQLYGIITTPENQELISTWCNESGIQTNVMTFDGFERQMEVERQMEQDFSDAFDKIISGMDYEVSQDIEINENDNLSIDELDDDLSL